MKNSLQNMQEIADKQVGQNNATDQQVTGRKSHLTSNHGTLANMAESIQGTQANKQNTTDPHRQK